MMDNQENQHATQPDEPALQEQHNSRSGVRSALRRAGWMAGVVLAVCLVIRPANAQFDPGVAAILASLAQLNSLMQSAVGSPLSGINNIQNSYNQYEQNVVYPIQSIQAAVNAAANSTNTAQQITSILNVARISATLPVTRQLESQLLSGDPNQVNNISSSYAQVYGPLPSSGAPPQVVNMVDMTDAQAQDAQKKAIQLDALAAREMEVSQTMLTQLQSASPGSASITNAQASAWVLQGNAYTQSAMAELVRTRSAAVAAAGTLTKDDANKTTTGNSALQNFFSVGQGHN
jgi:hypothetical protein